MVAATHRRRAVDHLKNRRFSERRACRLVGFSRSASWRPLKVRNDEPLRSRLKKLAERYPRYGYPTLHDMLKTEGLAINPKRTYRLYREEGLQVRTKRHKKLIRPGTPMMVPDSVNQRWSMDFVSDQLANRRRFRVLNVVDDYSREIVLQVVDFSISGYRVAREAVLKDDLGVEPTPETYHAISRIRVSSESLTRQDAAKEEGKSLPDTPSIVILALQNLTEDSSISHICQGLADAFTTELARFRF